MPAADVLSWHRPLSEGARGQQRCDGQLWGCPVSLEVSRQPGALRRMTLSRADPFASVIWRR